MSDHVESTVFEEIDLSELSVEEAVRDVIRRAVELHASDLFFASNENEVAVNIRHLGMHKRLLGLTREMGRHFINHVMASAGMDVIQKRHPVDGRWVMKMADNGSVDMRINVIPTLFGQDLAIRLMERNLELLKLESLGFHRGNLDDLQTLLNSPSGLILVTGPAGSGKTTTLYAALNQLNDGTRKINTIEDPVEYSMLGVRQSEVNPRIDLDFPELLSAVLRQSPDVIMIGEIRDAVTAATAVRAANTGHLVFATLHAPVAAGAVGSLLSLGIVPHFLSTSLIGIISQRLVRTLCMECRTEFDLHGAAETFEDIRSYLEPGQGQHIYSSPGCDKCYGEGYTARTGIVEVLRVTPKIRRMILKRAKTGEIRDAAVEQGMLDLRRSALLKVAQGVTSMEEVMRVIPAEHLLPDD